MHGVIRLKVIVGIGHKALQLTTQQEVGQHIACIVGQLIGSAIAHSDRYMVGIGRLEVESNLFKGLVGLVRFVNGNSLAVIVMMIHEEQAVGQGLSCLIKHHQVIDARRQV